MNSIHLWPLMTSKKKTLKTISMDPRRLPEFRNVHNTFEGLTEISKFNGISAHIFSLFQRNWIFWRIQSLAMDVAILFFFSFSLLFICASFHSIYYYFQYKKKIGTWANRLYIRASYFPPPSSVTLLSKWWIPKCVIFILSNLFIKFVITFINVRLMLASFSLYEAIIYIYIK